MGARRLTWDAPALTALRSLARKTGVTRIAGIPSALRTRWRKFSYGLRHPTDVEASVGGVSQRMLVANSHEYARVLSYRDDKHLIGALLDRVAPGDCYWDVGSSLGLYALLLAAKVGPKGQVVAFEPEARSFARLKQNLEASHTLNVKPIQMALGEQKGQLTLTVAGHFTSGAHSLFAQTPPASDAGTVQETVEVLPGDDARAQLGLRVPTALKIDVEGAEEEVILGLRKTLGDAGCRAVLCEVHFAQLDARGRRDAPSRIVKHLGGCGFSRLDWIDRSHLLATK
jgi:FkbM family methyltransferase